MDNAPTTIEENLKYRALLLEKAKDNVDLQYAIKEKCKLDMGYLFDTFFWIYSPKQPLVYENGKNTKHRPFILYPRQRQLITSLNNLYTKSFNEEINLLLDKPRDVGATYTILAWCVAKWLFENFDVKVGSRVMDYVDKKGEPDCLFWKIDYLVGRLPKWLLPKGFSFDKNRRQAVMENPELGCSITGESANPNFGRGGRKSAIIFDELAFWEWARSSWESAGESTNLRITMSTPPESGKDSHFYKLKNGQRGKVHLFNFEWTDVPGRDQNWYNNKKNNKSEEEFAREVLKSYDGTTTGKVYAMDARSIRLSDVDYDPRFPLFCAWDFGLDTVAMIWLQKDDKNRIKIVDAYQNSQKAIGYYVPFITGEIKSSDYKYNEYDLKIIQRHKDWSKEITHYGDPSVKARDISTGKSTRDELSSKHNIYVQSKDWSGRKWTDLRDLTRPLFRRMEVNEVRCESLLDAIRGSRYPEKREGSQATSDPLKPVHDWCSHYRSALEYFADNEPGYIPKPYDPDNPEQYDENEHFNRLDIMNTI